MGTTGNNEVSLAISEQLFPNVSAHKHANA